MSTPRRQTGSIRGASGGISSWSCVASRVLFVRSMKPMLLAAAVLGAMTVRAHADAFDIKDLDGFEQCLQLDELLVTVRTADGTQTRLLGPREIQPRCITAGAQLLASSKDKAKIISFVDAVKRLSAAENALELVDLLTRVALPTCNDELVYDVLTAALEHPDKPRVGYVARATPIAARCLKDKSFRKDFSDELKSADKNLATHACDILLQEKVVTSCKGSKP